MNNFKSVIPSLLAKDELFEYSAFASDIGIRPGEKVTVLDAGKGFGNGMQLMLESFHPERGAVYKQVLGVIRVTVFND